MFGFGSQPNNNGAGGGGGFGTPAPAAPFSFGGSGGQPPQPPPNSAGFPNAPPFGFGNAASPSPMPPPSSGFGGIAAPASTFGSGMMFGTSPNVTGSAGGASTFGTSTFGQSSSATTTPGFGTSSNIAPAFSGPNSSSTPGLVMGGFAAATPFGDASSSGNNNRAPFGNPPAPAASQGLGPFGAPGGNSSSSSSTPFSNPFASNQPQSGAPSSISFSSSTNVAQPPLPSGGWSSRSTPTPATGTSPFGRPNTSTFPGPMASTSSSNSPFGFPAASGGYDDGMMDDAPPTVQSSGMVFGRPASIAPTGDGSGPVGQDSAAAAQANSEELQKLKERLEAKKKKVARMREAASATTLRADAPPFVPPSKSASEDKVGSTAYPPDQESVAQRNALRFSESANPATRSHLPEDLLSQSAEVTAAQNALRNSGGRSERENLENAVSLVGTCEHMCPDEELLRREREGDIQLLERCSPGVLHPQSWTLRNTMVKRFRRSAADYKLDVPEWVRPPDVLEKVCGYLEEWVMERDRQGDDPRYKSPPPPLDVYQYVWDRTRMVRKDFILQNYVGNGGKCDARAVRCHERIARWHAMCEHQLSHLSDFVVMQSQQNVQELGQTMKTLNQFYDDSMGRALIEAPDDQGRETRTDLSETDHGCTSAIVQGPVPVDYNGSSLNNTSEGEGKRLLGMHAIQSPNHGTAEPEMRGLYILLTMGNDGGMEVLKYAARLYQELPEVYHAAPVQLALSIFKAKTDKNYTRFFSILRSSSTPYLFACLMFKHVESMRKEAFETCSFAYGCVTKEGSSQYDQYPLRRFAALLCFENEDEARSACQHFNITVKDDTNGRPYISWKSSSFQEPKDPEKRTPIPLRPLKMLRTIESKLKGATRVAICRGEVSGEGSCLSSSQIQLRLDRSSNLASASETEGKVLLALREQAEEARKREEKRRLEKEQRQKADREKAKREADAQQLQARLQEERQRKEREKLEQVRLEQERQAQLVAMEQAAALKRAEEAAHKKRLEEERLEMLRREEEARIREQEERKRREEEELARQAAEMERKRKEHEEELRRQVEEQKRLELLRQQELKRKQLEAEEQRRQLELKDRVEAAKRTLVWRRMVYKTMRVENANIVRASLSAFMATRMHQNPPVALKARSSVQPSNTDDPNQLDLRRALDRYLYKRHDDHKHNDMLANHVRSRLEHSNFSSSRRNEDLKTFLFKVAVLLPRPHGSNEQSICGLARSWIRTQVDLGRVATSLSDSINARIVFVTEDSLSGRIECDAAVLIVPPPWSDSFRERHADLTTLAKRIDEGVPRVVMSLCEDFGRGVSNERKQSLAAILAGKFEEFVLVVNDDFDVNALNQKLLSGLHSLIETMAVLNPRAIERWSLARVYFECFDRVMKNGGELVRKEDFLRHTRTTVNAVLTDVQATCQAILQQETNWPSSEFSDFDSSDSAIVRDYFGKNVGLPLHWASLSLRHHIEPTLMKYARMVGSSFSDTVERLACDAPLRVQSKCQSLLDEGFSGACLRVALLWRVQADETQPDGVFIFLPTGQLNYIIDRACPYADPFPAIEGVERRWHGDHHHIEAFAEQIDPPPVTPGSALSTGKRPSSSSASAIEAVPQLPNQTKRQRLTTRVHRKRMVSRHVLESVAFTKKLERLCQELESNEIILTDEGPSFADTLYGGTSKGAGFL